MQHIHDIYEKLRPQQPTPAEERCSCASVRQIYLAYDLSENPIHCASCRGEVAPETIKLSQELAVTTADWRTTYGSIYKLWLQSGTYEQWALTQLSDANSPANREGIALKDALSQKLPCSYLWFWNEHRPTVCPVCNAPVQLLQNGFNSCAICNVFV